MEKVIHRAESRGHANHGWLDTYHTFSFAQYMDPERINFGALRVLNDDVIAGGGGFGTHPHNNMEIISIPVYGALEHKDSMGHKEVLRENEVQVMSAGTGLYHSEYNHYPDKAVNLLQVWVIPQEHNVVPRYDQKPFDPADRKNKLQQLLSPYPEEGLWIHQDAWFYRSDLDKDKELTYDLHKETSGVYLFVIEGQVSVEGETLKRRDGIGIWNTKSIQVKASEDAQLLFMEVPMVW